MTNRFLLLALARYELLDLMAALERADPGIDHQPQRDRVRDIAGELLLLESREAKAYAAETTAKAAPPPPETNGVLHRRRRHDATPPAPAESP